MATESLEAYPYLRREMERREREAMLDYVEDWLDGKADAPGQDSGGPIEIEVGERRDPYAPHELREGPGLTIIVSEDDGMVERLPGGATRLVPGRRKGGDGR